MIHWEIELNWWLECSEGGVRKLSQTSRIRAGRVSFSMCRHFLSCWKLTVPQMGSALGKLSQQSPTHTAAGPGRALPRGTLARCVCRGGDRGEWESTPHFSAPPTDYHCGPRITRYLKKNFFKRYQVSRFSIGDFPVFKCWQFIQFFKTPCRSNVRPTDLSTIENMRK